MSSLPILILRIPQILYIAAAAFFVVSVGLTYAEINSVIPYAESGNPVARLAMLKGLYQAALDAVYIAANGVIVRILLAIWADRGVAGHRGDDA